MSQAPAGPGRVVLDTDAMSRALARIAHEIIEANPDLDRVALVGIKTRGVTLGKRLQRLILERAQRELPFGEIDISHYRDDTDGPAEERSRTIDFSTADMTCVLVDDVLYTGRTIRAAIEALIEHGRPRRVQLACLVDRGHRELPIRPDFVGRNVPTTYDERVVVQVRENDGVDRVLVVPA